MRQAFVAGMIGLVATVGRFGGRLAGTTSGAMLSGLARVAPARVPIVVSVATQATLLWATSDARVAAAAMARRLGRSRSTALGLAAHGLLLRLGEHGATDRVAAALDDRLDDATRRWLAASAARARGQTDAAVEQLGPAASDDGACRSLRLELLRSSGSTTDVLRLANADLIGVEAAARFRFDALWDLGSVTKAVRAIDAAVTPEMRSVDTLRRARDAHRRVDGRDAAVLQEVIEAARGPSGSPDWYATVLFELDQTNRLVELGDDAKFVSSLGPTGRYQLARAHYVARRFDAARVLLRPLRSTGRRWDAEKLLARIELEEGISEEVVRRRAGSRRPGESFDEVEYLGLHQLGRHREAFDRFLPDEDRRRLVAAFGASASATVDGRVRRRFVVPQGGPGDEILLAAAYPALGDSADTTELACDPRLTGLLRRSFPSLRFHPCGRRASRSAPGFLATDQPSRAPHVLYEHLDETADAVAKSCDQVVMARALGALLVDRVPVDAYLRPDPDLVAAYAERLGDAVGVVWRSEFDDAIRSIHYLRPTDLEPLARLGRPIVCLQHDARPDERRELESVFDDVDFVDDVDLRDDFESMAAIAAAIGTVVGIGTTFVELAGAVGTTTVALHPSRLGLWRRRLGGGDYWHRSMQVAWVDALGDRRAVVDEAVRILGAPDRLGG
ncbi:MAG: hypothetical protein AAFZ07_11470 [Actinomycetota bacterium]